MSDSDQGVKKEEYNPFDKVFLVAQIAQLEVTARQYHQAVLDRDKMIKDMSLMLKDSAESVSKIARIPQHVAEAVLDSLESWVSEDKREIWRDLIKDTGLRKGFATQLRGFLLREIVVDGAGTRAGAFGQEKAGGHSGDQHTEGKTETA